MVAKQPEDLLLDRVTQSNCFRRVIGTAPTVLNANGANQKKFDESLLVRRGMKSQRARTNVFLWNGRSGRDEKRPERRFQRKRRILQFIGLVRAKTLPSFHSEEFAQFRPIRPIRVQTCWSRPDDRGAKSRSSAPVQADDPGSHGMQCLQTLDM